MKILQNGEKWSLSNMMYANDAVLMASSERNIKRLMENFAEVCKCCCFRVNVDKSKMLIDKSEGESVYSTCIMCKWMVRKWRSMVEDKLSSIEIRLRCDISKSLDRRVEESIAR